ncbi:LrgB-like protein [Beauveria brongniartii RCEF 3172]|uniref:LrgB-like protein n=1 Tax=Beauveria brongniartii RCEF 3172 TaxID=1081107 RepID=A0A167GJZ9_9HYPO|nr:LrgB-like protein [Beauveria brongniartii RCEF 3172]
MRSCLPSPRLFARLHEQNRRNQHNDNLTSSSIDMENTKNLMIKDRRLNIWHGFCGILLIAVFYLTSNLLIWGLSRALMPVNAEFLSSVLGMLIVFVAMMTLYAVIPSLDEFYEKHLRAKVDFINRHMGAAFAIPMVMVAGDSKMPPKTIALVIGVFLANSLVGWTVVFLLAKLTHFLTKRTFQLLRPAAQADAGFRMVEKTTSRNIVAQQDSDSFTSSEYCEAAPQRQSLIWYWICELWPVALSLLAGITVGLPVAVAVGDPRIADGCAIWFFWIGSVTLQRVMKQQAKNHERAPRTLGILATLANPVMLTILLMTAYTRAKAYSMSINISEVLHKLSSGLQLYTVWTLGGEQRPEFGHHWFGAGDAALSLLGCGFVVWGFKLFECRRQLFSASGIVTIFVSIVVAVGNVFLGTYAGFLMGLDRPEALACAARMTTLALAIPAMKNVGGNTSLTVALMITNGILGQLVYPQSLDGTTPGHNQLKRKASTNSCESTDTVMVISAVLPAYEGDDHVDSTNTVAAGITIGINGAAMGVAYLHEHKSRAAPYAVLAMTTYSVATVIFIATQPFKDALLRLV